MSEQEDLGRDEPDEGAGVQAETDWDENEPTLHQGEEGQQESE
jgi:hypothetical protein